MFSVASRRCYMTSCLMMATPAHNSCQQSKRQDNNACYDNGNERALQTRMLLQMLSYNGFVVMRQSCHNLSKIT